MNKKPLCECHFPDKSSERDARQEFLRKYGDDLPECIIQDMTDDKHWNNWLTHCKCSHPQEIISAVHYEHMDWYLCTIKGLAVNKEERGQGYGKGITKEMVDLALKDDHCKVLAGDVTFDNEASLRSLKAAGFKPVGDFCWQSGEKPASIVHLINYKPSSDMSCPV